MALVKLFLTHVQIVVGMGKQVRKKLRINIPAGVDTGTKLRVSGEGDVG